MVVTAMMAFIVIWKVWQWTPLAAAALMLPFIVVDATFLSANLMKVSMAARSTPTRSAIISSGIPASRSLSAVEYGSGS